MLEQMTAQVGGAALQPPRQRHELYRRVFHAVTHGRLRLTDARGIREVLDSARRVASHPIHGSGDLEPCRDMVRDAALEMGFPIEVTRNAALGAGEAISNALLHAGGGLIEVRSTEHTLLVHVRDNGAGIPFDLLPSATLVRGYSTRPSSLGLGFNIMREVARHVWLSTGPHGTDLVLEFEAPQAAAPYLPDVLA